jgi:hypothetical protein
MIAGVLAVLAFQAIPPPQPMGDFFPGPWFVPVDRVTGELARDAEIIERMRERRRFCRSCASCCAGREDRRFVPTSSVRLLSAFGRPASGAYESPLRWLVPIMSGHAIFQAC